MRKAIPARCADLTIAPLWHDIVVPQEHAIKRLCRGDQLFAISRKDDAIDQLVDGRILDADQIA